MTSESHPPGDERPDSAGAEEPLVSRADGPAAGPASGEDAPVQESEFTPGGAPAAGTERELPELPDYESPASIRSRERRESHREPQREAPNMLPGRERRRTGVERLLVRLIATAGIVGIGVAIAAIMVSSKSQGWIVGLVVSIVSVVLAGVLWSSRQL